MLLVLKPKDAAAKLLGREGELDTRFIIKFQSTRKVCFSFSPISNFAFDRLFASV
jgi:hypothetical protein